VREIIDRLAALVREFHADDTTGHDWYHIDRVRKLALRICPYEAADPILVEIAALIHDVNDRKLRRPGDVVDHAQRMLEEAKVPPELAAQALDIAKRVSFKGAEVQDDMPTIEGKIVQDADRLDAIGYIGIARAFAYGGAIGRPMFDPKTEVVEAKSEEEYIVSSQKGSTINHFYEKLFLLKGRLHTHFARLIAENRHDRMKYFVYGFKDEWYGGTD
jgi:uncharacterized protein